MQLLFVRHGLPLRSAPGHGSDPALAPDGVTQAARLPAALARHRITRIVASPQRRAIQTAEPVAAARRLGIDIDERFAEYDRELGHYLPLEEIRAHHPAEWARLAGGALPSGVDADAFCARVGAAVRDVAADAAHDDTVAVFSHGGVVNAVLHAALGTRTLLSFAVDYASITTVLVSRDGRQRVAGVNTIDHVWDVLPHRRGRSDIQTR